MMRLDLIAFWQRCNLAQAPFAHPDDLSALEEFEGRYVDKEAHDFDSFILSPRFGKFDDARFHLSLLPQPYCGNLSEADIFVLMLNPGFGVVDYYAESRTVKFGDRLRRMLAQDFADVDFPFLWLDPEYCWHGGFSWWERKLRDVLVILATKKFCGNYRDALRCMSRHLACIELIPYRSPSFKAHRLIDKLPSAHQARQFVQETLVNAAKQGKATIIVTRQVDKWHLPGKSPNLIRYEGGHARGASLGSRTSGGRAILARFGIEVPVS